MPSTGEGVYRSTEYSVVQNRSILESWTSRLQERPKINFRNFGTSVLRSIVRRQSEIILYKSYATPPLRVALLLGRRYAPVTAAVGHEPSSHLSSRHRLGLPRDVVFLTWWPFLPSRRKWDQNDQVESAFYLLKHHGTLRRAGGGRKVESISCKLYKLYIFCLLIYLLRKTCFRFYLSTFL
jgi:hypothetical protein